MSAAHGDFELVKEVRKDFFDKRAALRSAPRLSAISGQFDARSAKSVFCHAHVAAENESNIFRRCDGEFCEAFLTD